MTNILDFSETITSIVLHDLASSISAIGNGLEVLEMSENIDPNSEIFKTITQSSEKLNTVFKFLRFICTKSNICFQNTKDELLELIKQYLIISSINADFSGANDLQLENLRSRLLTNLVLIMAKSMPKGGVITVNSTPKADNMVEIEIVGKGEVIQQNPDMEFILTKHEMKKLTQENAYIYHAAKILGLAGHMVNLEYSDDSIKINYVSSAN